MNYLLPLSIFLTGLTLSVFVLVFSPFDVLKAGIQGSSTVINYQESSASPEIGLLALSASSLERGFPMPASGGSEPCAGEVPGPWSSCSARPTWGEVIWRDDCTADCGGGIQRGDRQCRNTTGTQSRVVRGFVETPGSGCVLLLSRTETRSCTESCSGPSLLTRTCNTHDCPAEPTYRWQTTGWSLCSEDCDGGVQTRTVTCVRNDSVVVADSFCPSNERPADSRSCNTHACPPVYTYTWINPPWGPCQGVCGLGIQTRVSPIQCLRNDSVVVADSFCPSNERPVESRVCNAGPCEWSGCQGTCGMGTETRTTVIENPPGSGNFEEVTESRSCPLRPCPPQVVVEGEFPLVGPGVTVGSSANITPANRVNVRWRITEDSRNDPSTVTNCEPQDSLTGAITIPTGARNIPINRFTLGEALRFGVRCQSVNAQGVSPWRSDFLRLHMLQPSITLEHNPRLVRSGSTSNINWEIEQTDRGLPGALTISVLSNPLLDYDLDCSLTGASNQSFRIPLERWYVDGVDSRELFASFETQMRCRVLTNNVQGELLSDTDRVEVLPSLEEI